MFKESTDDRISSWVEFRQGLTNSHDVLLEIWNFWKLAPYVHYNNKIDPYHQRSWPSPWEIIATNKYDDFTKALMIGWTCKLVDRYKDSKVEVRTIVDKEQRVVYNVVFVDDLIAINYSDNGPILVKDIPDSFFIENIVELNRPR
jgi:hypothetical protein